MRRFDSLQNVVLACRFPGVARLVLKPLGAAVLLILLAAPASQAIIINDTVGFSGSLALGAPHLAVVNLTVGGNQGCTGTLIDSTHILTAQHCTTGSAANIWTVEFVNNDGITVSATRAVTAKAEMAGYVDANFLAGLDVAILTMASAAPVDVTTASMGPARSRPGRASIEKTRTFWVSAPASM